MKLTIAVLDQASGATLHTDAWHLPDKIEAALDPHTWQSPIHDLPELAAGAGLRWWLSACDCLTCRWAVDGELTGGPPPPETTEGQPAPGR